MSQLTEMVIGVAIVAGAIAGFAVAWYLQRREQRKAEAVLREAREVAAVVAGLKEQLDALRRSM